MVGGWVKELLKERCILLTQKLLLSFFWDLIFFRVVLDSQQKWKEGTEVSHMPSPAHRHSFPHGQRHVAEWHTSDQGWAYTGDFPGGSGKESTCNAGDPGSIPESGRSPGGGHGNPLQCSCLENPMDRGVLQAMVHQVAKSRTQLNWLCTKCKPELPSSSVKFSVLSCIRESAYLRNHGGTYHTEEERWFQSGPEEGEFRYHLNDTVFW